ncbi:MAG: hypothetical protein R3B56_05205 [Candidatus Scalinduaceae bacterium]
MILILKNRSVGKLVRALEQDGFKTLMATGELLKIVSNEEERKWA